MNLSAVPARITIDFRDAVHPSRTWILGLGDESHNPARVDLIAFEQPFPALDVPRRGLVRPSPTALSAECACPEFCERDHANE
jgi:hypothetical protein